MATRTLEKLFEFVPNHFIPLLSQIKRFVVTSYVNSIKSLYVFLKEHQWEFTANTLASLLIEPIQTFRAAYLLQTSLCKTQPLPINPTALTQAQLGHAPILLIHGDHSNSGLFTPLVHDLIKKHPHRPIFTLDLVSKNGLVSAQQHLDILSTKLLSIATLYPVMPKVICIGHSSGGDVLGPLAKKHPLHVGKLIKIGSTFKKGMAEEFERLFQEPVLEIVGTRDVIEGCNSYLRNKLVVASGHIGLLFDKLALKRIDDFLNRAYG